MKKQETKTTINFKEIDNEELMNMKDELISETQTEESGDNYFCCFPPSFQTPEEGRREYVKNMRALKSIIKEILRRVRKDEWIYERKPVKHRNKEEQ